MSRRCLPIPAGTGTETASAGTGPAVPAREGPLCLLSLRVTIAAEVTASATEAIAAVGIEGATGEGAEVASATEENGGAAADGAIVGRLKSRKRNLLKIKRNKPRSRQKRLLKKGLLILQLKPRLPNDPAQRRRPRPRHLATKLPPAKRRKRNPALPDPLIDASTK